MAMFREVSAFGAMLTLTSLLLRPINAEATAKSNAVFDEASYTYYEQALPVFTAAAEPFYDDDLSQIASVSLPFTPRPQRYPAIPKRPVEPICIMAPGDVVSEFVRNLLCVLNLERID